MNRGYGPSWLAPLTGVLFFVVVIISFIVMGEPKDAEEPVEEIVGFYVDNQDSVQVSAFLGVLGSLLLVTFGAYLRNFLRRATGDDAITPTLAFAGTVVVGIAIAFDSTLSFALAEAADNIDPSGVQSLQALWDNDFLPFILGVALFLLGTGLAILQSGALPKWLRRSDDRRADHRLHADRVGCRDHRRPLDRRAQRDADDEGARRGCTRGLAPPATSTREEPRSGGALLRPGSPSGRQDRGLRGRTQMAPINRQPGSNS